ncbi:MAG: hypothetical protein M1816_003004 [Peltula sp. TS41687]|nr:MAG: hypothetical protein M1816_003004 [Peltula sp. TS41687]
MKEAGWTKDCWQNFWAAVEREAAAEEEDGNPTLKVEIEMDRQAEAAEAKDGGILQAPGPRRAACAMEVKRMKKGHPGSGARGDT